jgi:hypothetical protein
MPDALSMPQRCLLSKPRAADRFRPVKALAVVVLLGALVAVGSAASAPKRPWLWQCEQIHLDQAKDACYIRLLLQDIDRAGNPATELPKIDARAKATPTSLYQRCHLLMHSVGRQWALEHHLTLEGLQKVVPRSDDPGCSAGFGMGLVMALGPQIIATGGKSALKTCVDLPTRWREFTCVHSLGHALMRGYHESLYLAVHACSKLGARYAPDCEQGAFHDYWISLRGADDASSPLHPVHSPRVLCAQYARYAVQCWYRYWIEQAPGPVILGARDLLRLCHGLKGTQREGCIAGAEKDVYDTPAAQMAMCEKLRAADALACVRGVGNQAYAGQPKRELALMRDCRRLAAGAVAGCAAWFGQTFNVVEDGRFLRSGCPRLPAALRSGCKVGAERWRGPLVTFS